MIRNCSACGSSISLFGRIGAVLLLWATASTASAQELLTATAFFDTVAARYAEITDYVAEVAILSGSERMSGIMSFMAPKFLRIDFVEPNEQVLVSNGQELKVYIPRLNVTLLQGLRARETEIPGGIATPAGLTLLRRNYSIAYSVGPDAVPLSADEPEPVVKLMLNWRNANEGFRQIEISVGEDGMIRRVAAVTSQYQPVEFDFSNVQLNQEIPAARFEYDSPASSNIYNNFLFGTGTGTGGGN